MGYGCNQDDPTDGPTSSRDDADRVYSSEKKCRKNDNLYLCTFANKLEGRETLRDQYYGETYIIRFSGYDYDIHKL